MRLPPQLDRALARRLGSAYESWVRVALPATLRRLEVEWGMSVGEPVGGGATAAVFEATTSDGRPAILKVHPDADSARLEKAGWDTWSPDAVPPLIAAEVDAGALLQPRITPGFSQLDLAFPTVAGETAELLRSMHSTEPPGGLHDFGDRVRARFERSRSYGADVVPPLLLRAAEARAEELLSGPHDTVVLHGDFFPDNILWDAERGWVTIDFQPLAGDPAFDAGTWCYAWRRGANARAYAGTFEEVMGQPADRIAGWAAVVAITNLSGRLAYAHASAAEAASTLEFVESELSA